VKAIVGRLRSKYVKFRVGRMTFWFFPFWWRNDHQHAVGSGWRCLSWVRRPANAPAHLTPASGGKVPPVVRLIHL
jgi:hypothetical protein